MVLRLKSSYAPKIEEKSTENRGDPCRTSSLDNSEYSLAFRVLRNAKEDKCSLHQSVVPSKNDYAGSKIIFSRSIWAYLECFQVQ